MESAIDRKRRQKERKSVRVVINGKVQSVNFGNWAVVKARGLGLSGWVRKKQDGSIELVLSGKPDDVDAMVTAARIGPPGCRVTRVRLFPYLEETPIGTFSLLSSM